MDFYYTIVLVGKKHTQGSPNPKIRFLDQRVCPVDCTWTQTDKVNTEDTLLGFQECFRQVSVKQWLYAEIKSNEDYLM